MPDLHKGMVAGVIMEKAKARTREEWERELSKVWDEACRRIEKTPGFKGMLAYWDISNSGNVIMMGLWEDRDRRMNYEGTTAQSVRDLFNPLFEDVPDRPRYVITHSHGPADEK